MSPFLVMDAPWIFMTSTRPAWEVNTANCHTNSRPKSFTLCAVNHRSTHETVKR